MKKKNLLATLAALLIVPVFSVNVSAASISTSKAKSIVLADSKVKESNLHDYEVEKDTYKGKAVYSIEFESKGVEYEYEVQRSNGKILKKEVEGKVSTDQCISVTKTKKIVFADAKVSEKNVRDFEIERNVYKTVNSYSVEFEVKGVEFEYEVSRKSGKILYKRKEGNKTTSTSISAAKAKTAALNDAGLKASEIDDYDIERDVYKGVNSYSIEFEASGVEYEYEVSRKSGKILYKEVEGQKVNASISKTKVKEIVLKDAGVSASKVKDYDVELDNEKGVAVYEIDFEVGNTEYEYKVNAANGKILKKEVDRD